MHVLHVVGARPNFMKAAPVMRALARREGVRQTLVHTGQHYDGNMSDVFFRQLGMPEPDFNLGVGSGSHAQQTAAVISRFEPVLQECNPEIVLVYGDVNSTVAATLDCSKLMTPVGHVEAGLRSFDRTMPEEINRVITDQLADLLFTPSEDGDVNLAREGISKEKIHRVGNVMIDTLVRLLPEAQKKWGQLKSRYGLRRFGLVTLHRPSNVDDPATLRRVLEALDDIGDELPLIFPIHPRTKQVLESLDLAVNDSRVQLVETLGYLEFLCLESRAALVITDSGGVQEETTFLAVPCLTIRENTERPVTVSVGTNILVGGDMQILKREVANILAGNAKKGQIPSLWDGEASSRIADELTKWRPFG